jgi:hypothetical protein
LSNRFDVIPIDGLALNAAPLSSRRNAVSRCLSGCRHGNGPTVVLTQEDHWGAKDASEVHCLVCLAFRRSTIAKEHENDLLLTALLGG